MMRKVLLSVVILLGFSQFATGQYLIYDDKMQFEFYQKQLQSENKENLISIIKEKKGDPYRRAAAVKVLGERYLQGANPTEKKGLEDILRTVFRKGGSSFIRIEIAYALCNSNRQQYFPDMVPFLIRRLDNENSVVAQLANTRLEGILNKQDISTKEAWVVLDAVKRAILAQEKEKTGPSEKALLRELDLIRWSLKILGDAGYRSLPRNIIALLNKGGEENGKRE